MPNPKLIQINIAAAKDIARLLGRSEAELCTCSQQDLHKPGCPGHKAWQLRNYLTQRINNPNERYGI